jgi:hypothetical protein
MLCFRRQNSNLLCFSVKHTLYVKKCQAKGACVIPPITKIYIFSRIRFTVIQPLKLSAYDLYVLHHILFCLNVIIVILFAIYYSIHYCYSCIYSFIIVALKVRCIIWDIFSLYTLVSLAITSLLQCDTGHRGKNKVLRIALHVTVFDVVSAYINKGKCSQSCYNNNCV